MLKNVKYLLTTHNIEDLPQDNFPEIVVVGKSNVGKSTLINALTNNSKLALISSKPGKTKAISLFEVNKKFRIVDLPGYGYAKVSKKEKDFFLTLIADYLANRKNISKVILLLDMRREISDYDWLMINYLLEYKIPFVVIGTKKDKVNQSQKSKFNKMIKDELSTTVINTSFFKKEGIKELELLFNEYL